MDQKRFLLFIVLSMAILFGWNALMMRMRPPKQPRPAAQNQQDNRADGKAGNDKQADAGREVASASADHC